MSEFVASQTMEEFMLSDKYVRLLAGPIGGGKSVCCAHDLMRWATQQRPNADGIRKTRFLIVRNTADQLKSTTLKTIIDWFPPEVYGSYSKTERTLYYRLRLPDNTIVQTEWMLIALDTPDDVRKALSLEATGLWGNECRELHPEVVDGLLMRVNRYPSSKDGGVTRAGAIFDTNYPDEETWWEEKMVNPPRNWSIHEQPPAVLPMEAWIERYQRDPPEAETGMSAEGTWYAVDPAADNYKHLEKSYYPNTLEGKTEDFIRVYLRCQFGRAMGGKPVYEATFKPDRHIAADTLNYIPSEQYPLCIGLDFGRTPAAVICQLTPRGTISVLSEITSENMGIKTFVQQHLKPHLVAHYPGMPTFIAPDPAGWAKSQNDELSPVDILEAEGFRVVKPSTNKPEMRIEAVEAVLQQSSDSEPRLKIDRSCRMLTQGFRGKYRWKTNRRGEVTNAREPDKNDWSHCFTGDTLVATPNGEVEIGNLQVGDLVCTPLGSQKVTATMSRLATELVELRLSNGSALMCTPDHPFPTSRGTVRADELQYFDVLESIGVDSWRTKPLTVSDFTSSHQDTGQQTAEPKYQNDICTDTCGGTTTAQYRSAAKYITLTRSGLTTPSRILSSWLQQITPSTTLMCALRLIPNPFTVLCELHRPLQSTGTHQTQAASGTEIMHDGLLLRDQSSANTSRAVIAELPTPQEDGMQNAGSAAQRANQQLDVLAVWTTRLVNALSAILSSQSTSTARPVHVVSRANVSCSHEPRRVYDLTVAAEHLFYANGVLTHNCHDAFQYAILTIDGSGFGSKVSGRRQRRQVQRRSSAGWT